MVAGERDKIPFISQHDESLPTDWRERSCGLASLAMILGYWRSKNKNIVQSPLPLLLELGLERQAYLLGAGWLHRGLIRLAQSFGATGWNKDLTFAASDLAWQELATDLGHYPLIVSVYKNFSPNEKGNSHLLVVSGLEGENIFLLDPKEIDEKDGRITMPVAKFRAGWTQRHIAIFPQN